MDSRYVVKMKKLLSITDSKEDTKIEYELELARDTINLQRNFTPTDDNEVEPQYRSLMVEMAMSSYSKRGAEGELAHSENGISRTYETGNIYPSSLLKQIIPKVKGKYK